MVFAVVTGGGTSGHVLPARAILESLMEAGHDASQLRYVGARRGMETTLLADWSVETVFLPVSGLQRSLAPSVWGRNVAFVWRLVRSRLMARRLIRAWKPKVVVSVGGYASAPIAMAAVRAGVPLVCVSYDRVAGLATKRQARHAAVTATAFPDSGLPRAVHTGAPVRASLRHLDARAARAEARGRLGIAPDAVCLTIMGGSLGSRILNDRVAALVEACHGIEGLTVVHICGARNLDDPVPVLDASVRYMRLGYVESMDDVYAATDLLVCRAGASTIAEIATVGVAAVVVPWSGATDDHQTKNAHWLADGAGAMVVTEEQWSRPDALVLVAGLMRDASARAALAGAARAMGQMHRSHALVDAIENAAR